MMDSYLRPVTDIDPTQPITTNVLTFCKCTTRDQGFVYLPLVNQRHWFQHRSWAQGPTSVPIYYHD